MRLATVLLVGGVLVLTGPTAGEERTQQGAWEGVSLITQARALAGHVTPGDPSGFPIRLTKPGSYRLAGNLRLLDADITAIVIMADNVTLDFNGFAILGPTRCEAVAPPTTIRCTPAGTGIGVDARRQRAIAVVNGIVRGMGGGGVLLGEESY